MISSLFLMISSASVSSAFRLFRLSMLRWCSRSSGAVTSSRLSSLYTPVCPVFPVRPVFFPPLPISLFFSSVKALILAWICSNSSSVCGSAFLNCFNSELISFNRLTVLSKPVFILLTRPAAPLVISLKESIESAEDESTSLTLKPASFIISSNSLVSLMALSRAIWANAKAVPFALAPDAAAACSSVRS